MNKVILKHFILMSTHITAVVVGYPALNAPAQEGSEEQTIVTVQTVLIATNTLHGYIQAYGEVVPDPGGAKWFITAPLAGIVQRVLCADGQKVKSGEVLFELNPKAAEIALQSAKDAVDFAKSQMARQEKLLEIKTTSEKSVQEARQQLATAQTELSKTDYERSLTTIHATDDGTMIHVMTSLGTSVNPADELAEVWNLNRLLVLTQVPSGEMKEVKKGQTVVLNAGAEPKEEGSVIYCADLINPAMGTIEVRVALEPVSALRCGQFVSARIKHTEHANCLTVPEASVVLTPSGESSIAIIEGEIACIHIVKTGLRESGRVEVSAPGINAGMQVITAGAYGLPDKTRIRIVNPQSMPPETSTNE